MTRVQKLLLACGVAYSLVYVIANDVVAAGLYDGYSRVTQAVSELSGVGAPSRTFLGVVGPILNIVLIGFGIGVWQSARGRRALRWTGGLLAAQGLLAFAWIIGPMSSRETLAAGGHTFADTLHLVLTALSVLFIVAEIGVAAVAFGRRFRAYSALSIVVTLAAGAVTSVMSGGVGTGEATPWLGAMERLCMAPWLLWLAVLPLAIWRTSSRAERHQPPARPRSTPRTGDVVAAA